MNKMNNIKNNLFSNKEPQKIEKEENKNEKKQEDLENAKENEKKQENIENGNANEKKPENIKIAIETNQLEQKSKGIESEKLQEEENQAKTAAMSILGTMEHILRNSMVNLVDKVQGRGMVSGALEHADVSELVSGSLIGLCARSEQLRTLLAEKDRRMDEWTDKLTDYQTQLKTERENMEKYKKETYYDSMGLFHKKKEIKLIENDIEFFRVMVSKLR